MSKCIPIHTLNRTHNFICNAHAGRRLLEEGFNIGGLFVDGEMAMDEN